MAFIRMKTQGYKEVTWYKSTGGSHYICAEDLTKKRIGEVYYDRDKGSWRPEVVRAGKLVPIEGSFPIFGMAADKVVKVWKTGQGG